MSWESYRKLDDNKEVSVDPKESTWEKENIPLLLSGFMEFTSGRKPRCRLSLTLVFNRSRWCVKLSDRVSKKLAWIELDDLDEFLPNLEAALKTGEIIWEDDQWSSNGA